MSRDPYNLDDKQLQYESVKAALIYLQLDQDDEHQVAITPLQLSEEEQAHYSHKCYVLIDQEHPLLVYRLQDDGAYQVREDTKSEEEQEASQVLMLALHYLEKDIAHIREIKVIEEASPGKDAPYSARWSLNLDGDQCTVVRDDTPEGPSYRILPM